MDAATDARATGILTVGEGRGFVVRCRHLGVVEPIIITAAHCLPRLPPPNEHLLQLPPPHPMSYLGERTWRILGPLGTKPTVMAECLFVDLVADIAVFGEPDSQALSDEANAYEQLLATMLPFVITDAPAMGFEMLSLPFGRSKKIKNPTPGKGAARVLSLSGHWVKGNIERHSHWLSFAPAEALAAGMSGSPIVSPGGEAIGVVSIDSGGPVLVDSLPAWLMRAIRAVRNAKH